MIPFITTNKVSVALFGKIDLLSLKYTQKYNKKNNESYSSDI